MLMATTERRKGAACPETTDLAGADPVAPGDVDADPALPAEEQDYFFWGINEFYVAP
jgi:hypothetical protein